MTESEAPQEMPAPEHVLTADEILNATDLPLERVDVPEWNGVIYIRTITAKERDEFDASLLVGKGKKQHADLSNSRAKLVVLTACDADGNRIFNSTHIRQLGQKSGSAMERCAKVAQRLCGMTDQDLEEVTEN